MHVEIWSDIACPWCHIGKRRFEKALADFEHRDEVRVTWRSFELDPTAPAERPEPGDQHLARKYGTSLERARGMLEQMTQVAAAEGLDFRFDRARGGNTFDAHRIVHLAEHHGAQDAMKERLLGAYLTEGELMSDHATLRRLAAQVGLPELDVAEILASDGFAEEVRHDERTAASLGVSGVPFFVVDRAVGVSGAQQPELLLQMLRQGWEQHASIAMVANGATCGPDGC